MFPILPRAPVVQVTCPSCWALPATLTHRGRAWGSERVGDSYSLPSCTQLVVSTQVCPSGCGGRGLGFFLPGPAFWVSGTWRHLCGYAAWRSVDRGQSPAVSPPSPKSGLGDLMKDPLLAAKFLFVERSGGPTPHLHSLCLQTGAWQVLCGCMSIPSPSEDLPGPVSDGHRTHKGASQNAESTCIWSGTFSPTASPTPHGSQPGHAVIRQKPPRGCLTCPRTPSCRAVGRTTL